MKRRLSVEAFAKVNRSLVVLGKRPDGYHELDTIFQTVDLTDRIDFLEREDGEFFLTIDGVDLAVTEKNLILRAAHALKESCGTSAGADIHLSKKIPVGAGLGGGSSNAAATLRGLSALWNLAVSSQNSQSLASSLGSDVPFFLHGGTARGKGRGELIEPLPDAPPEALVLVFPPFALSTAEVYGALVARRTGIDMAPAAAGLGGTDRNDLEEPAERLRPELRLLREALRDAGARQARLSGSGSTVFGAFESLARAREAVAAVAGRVGPSTIRVVETVSRAEFARRSRPRETGTVAGEGGFEPPNGGSKDR